MDDEPHRAEAVVHLLKPGTFGTGREGLDTVDRRFYIVQCPVHVRTGIHLDPNGGDARSRYGLDRLHVVEPADPVLDLDDDRLLDLLRRGTGIGHRDFDVVEWGDGPGFPLEAGQRHEPGCHDAHHQEIGRDAVAGHIGERTGALAAAARFGTRAGTHRTGSAKVWTHIPPTANGSPPVTPGWPACRVTDTSSSPLSSLSGVGTRPPGRVRSWPATRSAASAISFGAAGLPRISCSLRHRILEAMFRWVLRTATQS